MTGAISGSGTAYPSGAPEFTPGFSGVRVTQSSFMCMFCRSLFVLLYFFFLAIILSVLLRFWLSLWYLQTLLDRKCENEATHNWRVIPMYFLEWNVMSERFPLNIKYSDWKLNIDLS